MKNFLLIILLCFGLFAKDSRTNHVHTANYFASPTDQEWFSTNLTQMPTEEIPTGLLILNKKSNLYNRLWVLAHIEKEGVLSYAPIQYQELYGPKISDLETFHLVSELSLFHTIPSTNPDSISIKQFPTACCGITGGSIKTIQDDKGQVLMKSFYNDSIPIFGILEYTNMENKIPYSLLSASIIEPKDSVKINWNTNTLRRHYLNGFSFLYPADWFFIRVKAEEEEKASEYVFLRRSSSEQINLSIHTSSHSKEATAKSKIALIENLYYDALNLKEKSSNDFINKNQELISANIQYDEYSGLFLIAKRFHNRVIFFQIRYEFPEKILKQRIDLLFPLFQKIAMSLEES